MRQLRRRRGVPGAVQSCCPAREVVELKVGAQVMLLKVRKNKEKSRAEGMLEMYATCTDCLHSCCSLPGNCIPGNPRRSMI